MKSEADWDQQILSLVRDAIPRKYRKVELTDDTSLQRELGLDSVAIIALVFRFEETFGLSLGQLDLDLDFSRLRTVGELTQTGRSLLRQAQAAASS